MSAWPYRLERWRRVIEDAAAAYGLAPELIAAVMDRESGGGVYLIPIGPAGVGDQGHGRGLMQIDDRAHPEWCARMDLDGKPLWQKPEHNVAKGAEVLAHNLRIFGDVPSSVAAYNAGEGRVGRLVAMVPRPSIQQLDQLTTGHDYVSDVLDRLHKLQFDGAST